MEKRDNSGVLFRNDKKKMIVRPTIKGMLWWMAMNIGYLLGSKKAKQVNLWG